MCTNTNRALVNSLECYMDDLVDCFEDFVKKSIIVISVAVGVLVGVIAYVMKTIADRSQPPILPGNTTRGAALSGLQRNQTPSDSDASLNNKKSKRKRNIVNSSFMLYDYQDHKGTSTNNANLANDKLCREEKLLKDIGYSGCSKIDCKASIDKQSNSITRPSIPSLPTKEQSDAYPSQKNSNIKQNLESCCSMCCDDKCEG